jgi:hypothetical protein
VCKPCRVANAAGRDFVFHNLPLRKIPTMLDPSDWVAIALFVIAAIGAGVGAVVSGLIGLLVWFAKKFFDFAAAKLQGIEIALGLHGKKIDEIDGRVCELEERVDTERE